MIGCTSDGDRIFERALGPGGKGADADELR